MRVIWVLAAALAAAAACADRQPDMPAPGAAPATRLRETGLYVDDDASATRVRPGILSFEPQYPLWTDGAEKRRWVYLPAGAAIDASDPDAWRFPAGTRFWKEFSFGGKRVETRTLEKLADGSWRYATYVWLRDGSDALLAGGDGVPEGVPVAGGAGRHVIPSTDDCRACHEGRTTPVLGFSALQLSSDRDPNAVHAQPPRSGDLGLSALVERGVVRGWPSDLPPPRIAAATPEARAALGYLHGNCGGCHNAEGPLASLGMVLAQSARPGHEGEALASVVGRRSRFRAAARPDAELRVAPGHAGDSVLALRMRSRDPSLQMPPIGTLAVDDEALALIERWIDQQTALKKERQQP